MKNKLKNFKYAKAVGKSTLARIDWKDWKKEFPKHGEYIISIIKFDEEYHMIPSAYFKETFDNYTWHRVVAYGVGEIFIGKNSSDKSKNKLIAWGRVVSIVSMGKECNQCKRIDCVC